MNDDSAPVEVDLMDPEVQEDWYPTYDLLREQCPVYKVPGSGEYFLTRYADVQYVLRHPELFPNSRTSTSFKLLQSDEANRIYQEKGWPRSTPLGSNPPIHRYYRELIDPWLSAKNIEQFRPMITEIVDELIDLWVPGEPFEFMELFADRLPMRVITAIMGFPIEDREQLAEWAAAWVMPFARGLSEEQEIYVAEKGVEFQQYIVEHAHARRREPTDDLVSHIANATFGGDPAGPRPLTDEELAGVIDHLFVGGNETTTFALTSGIWLMGQQPEIQDRLRGDFTLIPQFIDEVLRLESPTQGLWKGVTDDVELGGRAIEAGSGVHVRFAAANRDPERFPCPADLDLDRPNSGRHLAFGAGTHRCPGEWLTRLEQVISYERIFSRFERIELVDELNTYEHVPGLVLRSLKELHVVCN